MKTIGRLMRLKMYYTCFPFVIFMSLIACKEKGSPNFESNIASVTANEVIVPVPFAGEWISEEYLERINSTGSPRSAQENIEACFIRIPDTTHQSTAMIYNFHESGGELVALKEDGKFVLREKQQFGAAPLTLIIEPIAPDKIRLGQKSFIRLQPVSNDQETRILEAILFKGTYTTNQGKKVEFTHQGEVKGLDGFRYYVPVIDYFDAGLQVDQVGLGPAQDALTYFGFKFEGDRLALYQLKCVTFNKDENRCVEVDFGEKIHDLTRSK